MYIKRITSLFQSELKMDIYHFKLKVIRILAQKYNTALPQVLCVIINTSTQQEVHT